MNTKWNRHVTCIVIAAVCVALAAAVSPGLAEPFGQIVVFGDSGSDPGNHFVAFGTTSWPPFAPLPDYPYAIGGHHFSNGATWIEHVTQALGTPTSGKPALREPGVFTNYAVGRARARAGAPEFPYFDLSTQVQRFLADVAGGAPSDALYVIWIGANDFDDALIAGQTDPALAASILEAAITTLAGNVYVLWAAGARNIMVLNLPDPAATPLVRALDPAVQAAATQAGVVYNAALADALYQVSGLPGLRLIPFDVKAVMEHIIVTLGDDRLANVTEPCLTFDVIRDAMCAHPDEYLFWDALHPTKAGHQLIAEAVLKVFDPDAE